MSLRSLLILLVPMVLVVPGLAGPTSAQAPSGATGPSAASDAWRLRPGDAVRLQVGDEQALRGQPQSGEQALLPFGLLGQIHTAGRQFPVTEEGIVLLPLVGRVAVAGRPFPEVREEILRAYGGKLVGTPVLVTPVARIAVLGEVGQPGLVAVDPTFTVADLLAAAGGVTPVGNPRGITLLGDWGSVRFSLTEDQGVLARSLRPGDQLVVPRRGWARENLNVLIGAGASVLAAAITTLILRPNP